MSYQGANILNTLQNKAKLTQGDLKCK